MEAGILEARQQIDVNNFNENNLAMEHFEETEVIFFEDNVSLKIGIHPVGRD